MLITGQHLAEKNIITNFLPENVKQQGIDLRVKSVFSVCNDVARIPKEGKTTKPRVTELQFDEGDWLVLSVGYYEVYFEEGCKLSANVGGKIIARSSLIRCGGDLHCGWHDAGFETNNLGCFLTVQRPIIIQKGSRLGQIVLWESETVNNLYNGQWNKIDSENVNNY